MAKHFLLRGIRERLIWAQKHIALLNKKVVAYVESDVHTVSVEFEDNPARYVVKADMRPGGSSEALALSLVLGDIVHNLRAILDHLAWVLVLVSGHIPSEHHPRTQFPLFHDRLTDNGRVRKITIAGGITDQAQTIVEAVQPYQRSDDPTRHPLSILNDLANVDKHRFVQLTRSQFAMTRVTLRRKSDGAILQEQERKETVEFYATVATFPAVGLPPPDEVEVDSEFTPLVTLDVPTRLSRMELTALVNEMEAYVRATAEMFAKYCFGAELL